MSLLETVVKRGSQYCVIHCHGAKAGQAIKCFPTKAQADAMHRAIQAHKHAGYTLEATIQEWDDCVAKYSHLQQPEAYCAGLLDIPIIHTGFEHESYRHPDFEKIYHQFLTHIKDKDEAISRYTDWIQALNLDETKPYGESRREQFQWIKRHADFRLWKEDADAKYWQFEAGFPLESMNRNVYTSEELLRAARTLKGKPVNINHEYEVAEIDVVAAEFEDDIVEGVIRVPKGVRCPINPSETVNDMIQTKGIVNNSLEAGCEFGVGIHGECEGMFFTGLSLLTRDTLPGIPLTRIMPLEAIMVEALQSSTNRRKRKVRKIKMEVYEQDGARSDPERAKAHFKISDEDWAKLSDAEKQAYIDKLPARGSAEQKDERPPKDWMDKCVSTVKSGKPDYTDEQANAVCGNIWHNIPKQRGIGDKYYTEKWLREQMTQVIATPAPPPKSVEPDEHGQCPEGMRLNALGKCVPTEECPEDQHWSAEANGGQGGCVPDTVPKPETPETSIGVTPAPREDVLTSGPTDVPSPGEQPPVTSPPTRPMPPEAEPVPGAPATLPTPVTPSKPSVPEPHTCELGHHYDYDANQCVPDELTTEKKARTQVLDESRRRKKAERRAAKKEKDAEYWESESLRMQKSATTLLATVKEKAATIRRLEGQIDRYNIEKVNDEVKIRDKQRRVEDLTVSRDDYKQQLEKLKGLYEQVVKKYNGTLAVNLELSRKNTQANEDYLEVASKCERLEAAMKKKDIMAKKQLRIKVK